MIFEDQPNGDSAPVTIDPGLEVLFKALECELEWLQAKWSEYQEVFGAGPGRREVLNAVASNFFYLLEQLLFQDAMLHLCRLTDRARSPVKGGPAENLTVQRLAEAISDPTLRAAVASAAEQARDRCEFALQWRDKWLAHTDLVINQHGWASALPSVTTKHIEDAIDSLSTTLNLINGYYNRPPVVRIKDPWGAKSLMHYLEKGLREK